MLYPDFSRPPSPRSSVSTVIRAAARARQKCPEPKRAAAAFRARVPPWSVQVRDVLERRVRAGDASRSGRPGMSSRRARGSLFCVSPKTSSSSCSRLGRVSPSAQTNPAVLHLVRRPKRRQTQTAPTRGTKSRAKPVRRTVRSPSATPRVSGQAREVPFCSRQRTGPAGAVLSKTADRPVLCGPRPPRTGH